MTVVSESIAGEHKRYSYLLLPEFMDLIGRVADRKYKNTNGLKLGSKIDFVLQNLFIVIGFQGSYTLQEEEEPSESDDEY